MAGSLQSVYRSDDQGSLWELVLSGTSDTTFVDMSFISDSVGWVSVSPNALVRTSNGGFSWEIIETPAQFWSIAFTDELLGWAGTGISGEIYHTSDGGTTWIRQRGTMTGPVSDLFVLDGHLAWAVGSWGAILHTTEAGTTSVEEDERPTQEPSGIAIRSAYPNPFNSETTFIFELERAAEIIHINIFDILGRRVFERQLLSLTPGEYRVTWSASDTGGKQVASGFYLITVQSHENIAHKKILLLR
jgi:photosystem II stability/assembly factor-like uncharacterized protein